MESVDEAATTERNMQTELVLTSIVDVTRCANNLPKSGETFELYSSYAMFSALLDQQGQRLKSLIDQLLRFHGTKASVSGLTSADELLETLEKASDVLAERIANSIDEADGKRKKHELVVVSESSLPKDSGSTLVINTSWNKRKIHAFDDKGAKSDELKLVTSRNVARPQLEFQASIDNSNRPFVSKLRFKHNARPLSGRRSNLTLFVDGQQCASSNDNVDDHPNPYKYELDHFTPTNFSLEPNLDPKEPAPLADTNFEFVDTEEQLQQLCQRLKTCSEFAVDLEHHSYRSFQGITCLMQISTRSMDFIIDPLRLWKSMHLLNDPFTDPAIVKVFHGADKDVEWLQRDFGIYVVNVFDTSQAMRVLNMARFSLAHLVSFYVGKELNKQFQLADWRIRPLPEELLNYAREDTHYLLYCYDRLKNDLLDSGNEMKNLLVSVFERSRDLCAKHYEKPLFDAESEANRLLAQCKKRLNSRQSLALRQLCEWRDATARAQDESLAYVLPSHMLLQMAEVLPREMHGLLSCCNPVPPLVKQDLQHLHSIVLGARQAPLVATTTSENSSENEHHPSNVGRKLVAKPHDFSHCDEDEEAMAVTQRILAACQSESFDLFKRRPKINLGNLGIVNDSETTQPRPTPYQSYRLSQMGAACGQNLIKFEEQPSPADLDNVNISVIGGDGLLSNDEKLKTGKRKFSESEGEEEPEEGAKDEAETDDKIVTLAALGKREKNKAKKKQLLAEQVKSFDYSSVDLNKKMGAANRTKAPDTYFDPRRNWTSKKGNKSKKFGSRNPKIHFGK